MRTGIGALGAAVVAVSAVYYFVEVLRGRSRPHQASWSVWAVIGLLGFGTAADGGAGPGAYAAAVDAVACTATCLLALHPRFGKPGLRRGDVVLGVAAASMVLLWRFGPVPVTAAAVVAVACDATALWPTVREARSRPAMESTLSWTADVVGNALCLAAVASTTTAALVYPTYLLLASVIMSVVLLKAGSRPTSRSSPMMPSTQRPPVLSRTGRT